MNRRTSRYPAKVGGTRRRQSDKRYRWARWRKTRLQVLRRDRWQCWHEGCDVPADTVDHIVPVDEFTTDAQFFNPANLRASCTPHNLLRGWQARRGPRRTGRTPTARPGEVLAVAVCEWCEREMTTAVSCTVRDFAPANEYDDRCRDCGARPGGLHHPGCCVARCAVCGDQATACWGEHTASRFVN